MNRFRLALRVAAGDVRRAPGTTAIVVAVLGIVIGACMVAPEQFGTETKWTATGGGVAAALVLVVVRLVLAVQERARLRSAALLGLSGARPADRLVSRTAIALGVTAGGALLGLAVLLAVANAPTTELLYPLRTRLTMTRGAADPALSRLVIAAAALAGALLAGLLPGRRQEIRPALAGRRPAGPAGALHLLGSLACLVTGIVAAGSVHEGSRTLAVIAAAGGCFLLGGVLLAACEPASRRLGVTARYAARGLARRRHVTAPLLGLTAVALTIASLVLTTQAANSALAVRRTAVLASLSYRSVPDDTVVLSTWGPSYGFGSPAVAPAAVEQVRAAVPDSRATDLEVIGHPNRLETVRSWHPDTGHIGSYLAVGVATPAVISALGLDAFRADVDAGRALALNPLAARPSGDGGHRVGLDLDGSGVVTDLDAVTVWPDRAVIDLPAVLVPPTAVAGRDLIRGRQVIVTSPAGIGADSRDRLARETADRISLHSPSGTTSIVMARPGGRLLAVQGSITSVGLPGPFDATALVGVGRGASETDISVAAVLTVEALAGIVVAALLLGVVGLGASQRAVDDHLLAVQGAPPGFRRRVAALEAGTLSGIAVVVALVLAPPAVWSLSAGIRRARPYETVLPLTVPGPGAVVLLATVPLLAAGAAWLLTPRSPRIDPRRLEDDPG